MGRKSSGADDGNDSNDIAAKHCEKRLKLGGHDEGISSAESTFLTARNCAAENPLVICDMISVGEGKAEPFVLSAQMRASVPSNSWLRSKMGMDVPRPYCWTRLLSPSTCATCERHTKRTHIVWFVKKDLCDCQEDTVRNGEHEASQYVQLANKIQSPQRCERYTHTQLCLESTIQFFHTRIPNCLQKSPAINNECTEKRT